MAEIAGATAQSQHEVIIAQRALFEENLPLVQIKAGNGLQQHRDLGPFRQYRADGLGNFGGGEARRSHLIEQRLEQIMICAIDNRYLRLATAKMLAECEPAEARAEHNYLRDFLVHHEEVCCR